MIRYVRIQHRRFDQINPNIYKLQPLLLKARLMLSLCVRRLNSRRFFSLKLSRTVEMKYNDIYKLEVARDTPTKNMLVDTLRAALCIASVT